MSGLDDLLTASLWAQTLTPEQRRRVEADSCLRTVPKGSFIYRRGDPAKCWVGIVDGLAKMTTTSAGGKITTLTSATNGAWFGEGTLLKGERLRYDVVALRDTRIACIPRPTFFWLLDNNIRFSRCLLEQMNERISHFIGMLEFDRLLAPDARVAHCLASLSNAVLSPGFDLLIKVSQEEIAQLVGLSRQRINRSLRRLEEAGLVRVDYGAITILDLKRLRAFE